MSLVNDALKKARLEAARGDAANRNMPYPLLGRGERPTSGPWIIALGTLGALVVLAVLGGFFLYRAGKQSALRANPAAPAPAGAAETSPLESTDVETGPATPEPATTGPDAAESAPSRLATHSVAPRSDTPLVVIPPVSYETPAETPFVGEHGAPDSAPRDVESTAPEPIGGRPPTDATPREFLRRADIPGIGPIELAGIAWSGDRPFALVNGRVVRPGDTVSGLLVDDIQPNTVRFRDDQGILVFKLK